MVTILKIIISQAGLQRTAPFAQGLPILDKSRSAEGTPVRAGTKNSDQAVCLLGIRKQAALCRSARWRHSDTSVPNFSFFLFACRRRRQAKRKKRGFSGTPRTPAK